MSYSAGGVHGGARGEERGRGARWCAVRGEERVSEPKHTVVRGASVRSRKRGARRQEDGASLGV